MVRRLATPVLFLIRTIERRQIQRRHQIRHKSRQMIFRKPIVQRRRHHQALIDLIIDKTFCHVLFFSDPADVSGPLHTPTRSVFINYLSCPSSTPLQLSPLLPPITESIPDRLLEIKNSDDQLRTIIETIPTLAWSASPDGSADFFNQRWLDYTGLSAEQALNWGW